MPDTWFLANKDSNLAKIKQAVEEAKQGQVTLIDVRTPEEFRTGYVTGAINWDLARLTNGDLPRLAKSQKTYLYCRSGGRAGVAKKILEREGYTDVVNLGGIDDLQSAGGAVIQ